MKKLLISITALLAAVASYGQGSVVFSTKSGTTVDAPVLYQGPAGAPTTADGNFFGQLYVASVGYIGDPVPFRTGSGQGYITAGGTLTVPGVAGGAAASIRLVGWSKEVSKPAAPGTGAGFNASPALSVTLGGGGTPPSPPALLAGLQGFTIPTVPEPSLAALGLLGAGLLLIRRKK